MNRKLYEVTCKHCHSQWMVTCESVIQAQIEPHLKQSIVEDSFFHRLCSNCKQTISFYYPLLYVDVKHKACIAFTTQEDAIWIQQLRGSAYYASYRIYEITSSSDMVECIHAIDAELDIQKINALKKLLSKRYAHMVFESSENQTLWFLSNKGRIGIPIKFYHRDIV